MLPQKYLLLFFANLLLTCQFAASQELCRPYIMNFARDKYQAANKNWSIGQDEKGTMYFGNDTGLLESDGLEWNLYPMPNASFVKSLAVESYSTIYSGGWEELGRWDRDLTGKLKYTSMKNLLPPGSLNNESFWRIWIDADKVYFQSFANIYIYNHQTIEKLTNPKGFMLMMKVRGEYWVQEMYGALYQLEAGKLSRLAGSEFLNNTLTRIILPYGENRYLIGTSTGQLYIYDREKFTPWNTALSRRLNGRELNCGIYCAKRNSYYLGTILSGIYEVDMGGNVLNHFYAPNALQNNTILALYEDKQNNIWAAMDRGLAYIRYTDGLSYYHTNDGNSGAVYAATLWNDYLLIGTNQGVYYTPKEKMNDSNIFSSLKFLKGTEGQVWSFRQIGELLFCSHNSGLLEIRPDLSIRQPYQIGTGVFRMLEATINQKDIYIVITYKEVYIVDKQTGRINVMGQIVDPIGNAEVDYLGNIWLETVNRGIYKCRLNEEMDAFRYYTYYGQEEDASLPAHLQVCKSSDRVLFLGDSLFYAYDEGKDNLHPIPLLNQCFEKIKGLKRVIPINGEESWAITSSSIYRFFYDGYVARVKEAYKIEADNLSLITASENISILNDSLSLVCLDAGFILHNSMHSQPQNTTIAMPDLKYIYTGRDDEPIDFHTDIRIPYKDNTVTIGFSVNDAFAGDLYVEYLLEGIDNTWSRPERKNSISYDRLPQGKYTLHLHSTDGLSNYSADTLVYFEILPPWYRTIWWYITCCLLVVASLFLIFLLMKRRVQAQHLKRIKVQEAERLRLMNEELQSEIEKKNAELFVQTSFIIHKNELILKLKGIVDDFFAKNSQKTLLPFYQKIDNLLTNNLNTEDDWKMFLIKFEQKHHEFFRALKENYPQLTNNDLRLCACLKLNMETKDIASLMNLSVRAVENNRYRLRKKLDLKPNQNLNDFFLQIV